ncbi:MAG: hypothetical protein AB2A00_29625 [Myxococcota bacterium]
MFARRLTLRCTVLAAMVATGCLIEQERTTTLPLLTNLNFDGAAADSPTVLLFSMDFRDSDRNLSAGTLKPLINGKPTGDEPVPLQDLFIASGLPLDTANGTLEFVLEVQISDENRPEPGSTFDVGFEATDGDGNVSNTPTSTLEISF